MKFTSNMRMCEKITKMQIFSVPPQYFTLQWAYCVFCFLAISHKLFGLRSWNFQQWWNNMSLTYFANFTHGWSQLHAPVIITWFHIFIFFFRTARPTNLKFMSQVCFTLPIKVWKFYAWPSTPSRSSELNVFFRFCVYLMNYKA